MISMGVQAPAEVAELADRVAGAVTRCPDVAGLAQAPGIPAARAGAVEVSVVARYGLPLPQVAAQVREAVAPLVPGQVVDVVIADIAALAPQTQPAAATAPAPAGRPSPGEVVKQEENGGNLPMDEVRMMPILGLAFGVALGFAGAFGGWSAFVIVLLLGLVGYAAGRVLAGELDMSRLFVTRERRPW
jgi:hypothetical protein